MCLALQDRVYDFMQKAVVFSQQRLDDQKHSCKYISSSNPRKYIADLLVRQKSERERRENIEKQRMQFEAQQNPRVKETPQARLTRERFDADKAAEVALHQITRRNPPASFSKPPPAPSQQHYQAFAQLHELYQKGMLSVTHNNLYRQLYAMIEQWKKYEKEKEAYQNLSRNNFSSSPVMGAPNSGNRGGANQSLAIQPSAPVLRKVTKKDLMVFSNKIRL